MNIFKMVSLLAFVFISVSANADEDQNFSQNVLEGITSYPRESRIADACNMINKQVKERVAALVASNNSELNADQLNAKTIYYTERRSLGHGQSQYNHVCELKIRLTNDSKRISSYSSNMVYTGSGRLAACENMKSEIDQSVKVLYSKADNGLFRCIVRPIISIESVN